MLNARKAVGRFLFDYIYEQGVETAFGIPGDFVLPTFRHLQESKIELKTMTHEPSVGFAADGYARARGLGLAVVTYCVGGLNMVNSVACAYAEKSPVIVVSGGPSPQDRHKDPMLHHKVRTFDTQYQIYKEITCASAVLLHPERAVSEIVRVVDEVKRQSRPGYIEIPFDITDEIINPAEHLFIHQPQIKGSDPDILNACVMEITDRINRAKQPVIIAGVELHRHRLTDVVADLAKAHNIPIAGTWMSKGVVGENNPLYIGVYSGAFSDPACQEYVENSDCVILIGAFISDELMGFGTTRLNRKNAIILTTEKTQVGWQSYEDILFEDILYSLCAAPIHHRIEFQPLPFQETPRIVLSQEERRMPLRVEAMFSILASCLQEGDTIISDTGDALVGALGIKSAIRGRFFSDAYYLSMGFAIPAALGVMSALPQSKTFIIVGDGAFQMTGMELSTMAKYGMTPIVLVINNDGYGTQRHIIDGPFNNIHPWHYTKVCDVLGYGKALRVDTKGAFEEVLKEAIQSKELFLIEAVVPRDDCSPALRRMGELLGKLRDKNKREIA